MKPKFYINSDNNHCLQCCARMVHDSILSQSLGESDVDADTEYDSSLWTWTIAGAQFLAQRLNGVKTINGGFNYQNFVDGGEAYLKRIWPVERLESQKAHASANFEKEIRLAKKFLKSGGEVNHQNFTKKSIYTIAKSNFLIVQVDPGILYGGQNSANSHYVLIYDQQQGGDVLVHDPGKPPRPSQAISLEAIILAFSNELITIPKPDWWDSDQEVGRNKPCPCRSGKKNKKCHDL